MNTDMNIIWSTFLAFAGSCAPALLFNINRNKIILAGFAGAMGWVIYCITFKAGVNPYVATFIGTFFVNCYSEIMARVKKSPALMFYIPALFPLVPGYTTYLAVLNLVQDNYQIAMMKGMESIGIAIAICFGIMVSAAIMKTLIKFYYKKKNHNLANGERQ